ncbi:TonB-dependent receptor domain-containing protein [Stenotrophomonas geniculata]|uniref:TonB-dependent receptor domain-containing protein n=1 Tax=Stenotrophomonas geniculata TaxID=86188 RepID=UPI003AAD5D5E
MPDGRSNPDLDAERSLNLELGWRLHKDRVRLGVSIFRDNYSNFIDTAQFVADEGTRYRNSRGVVTNGYTYAMPISRGETEVKGVEAESKWLVVDDWLARVAYSYNEGTDNDGEPLASIIPAKAVGGLNYNSPHGAGRHRQRHPPTAQGPFGLLQEHHQRQLWR